MRARKALIGTETAAKRHHSPFVTTRKFLMRAAKSAN